MTDMQWGDPAARNFGRRFIRTLTYEGVTIQVHRDVREIFETFLQAMSDAYIPIPASTIGWRLLGDDYERRGLSILMLNLPAPFPMPVMQAAARLGLTIVDDGPSVVFRGTRADADALAREIIEARTTDGDSILNSLREITRPGTRGLALGDIGPDVHFLQLFMHDERDNGVFGPTLEERVREFQTIRGLEPTGVVDQAFWLSMFPERTVQVGPGDGGMWVRMVQSLLVALAYSSNQITSTYGTRTTRDVRAMQEIHDLRITGFIRGPEWGVLVHRPVEGFPLE